MRRIVGYCLVLTISVHASRIDTWRKELDRATTSNQLRALRKKITKRMYKLVSDERETAHIFIDVIDRKLVRKPYAEDFRTYAES